MPIKKCILFAVIAAAGISGTAYAAENSSPQGAAQHQPLLAASMSAQDSVSLFEVNGSQLTLKKAVPAGKTPGRMCLDPASTTLFVAVKGGVAAIDLSSQSVTATMSDPAVKSIFGCVVSPDGHKLYAADRDANIVFVFGLPGHQLLKKINVPEDPRNGIFTPDHKQLVISCGDASQLAVVDPATDTVVRTIKMPGLDPRAFAITSDGKYLATALVSSDIISWYHADTLEPVNAFGGVYSPQDIVISPKRELLYAISARGGIGVLDLHQKNHEGVGEWRLLNTIPVDAGRSLDISNDGNFLYSTSDAGVSTIVDLESWTISKPGALKGASTVKFIP